MLFDVDKRIGFVHVELTQKCNGACPMCMHTTLKKKGQLDNSEIDVEDFKKIFSPVIHNIDLIWMCGNYSDPMTHSKIHEICKWIFDSSETTSVQINTNAALRSIEYWSELGSLFAEYTTPVRPNSGVVASIDGLEDTNEIYRVNCNFNKAIENCKAFIDAGGQAMWKYIVFNYNEHQLEEAKTMADELGFKMFSTVASSRFQHTSTVTYQDRKGNIKRVSSPEEKFVFTDVVNPPKSCIECAAIKRNEFFVNDKGLVMPCCWTAGRIAEHGNLGTDKYTQRVVDKYPNLMIELNAIENNIYNVFKHPFWHDLQLLWTMDTPFVCHSKCRMNQDDVAQYTHEGQELGWKKM